MKKTLLLVGLLAIAAVASAYDYPYLTIATADGQRQSLSVESLTLNVNDGQLIATNNLGTTTFTLTDLSKMYFSTADNGIATISSDATEVDIYNVYGVHLGRYSTQSAARKALTSGIYIIKSGNTTQKIIVE